MRREDLQRWFAEHFFLTNRIAEVGWTSIYRIHRRLAERLRVGCCFLVGDAAHIHSPAGGQGMNLGIGDGLNLGWKLALAATGAARPELLDTSEAERRPVARRIVEGADRGVELEATDNPLMEAFRLHLAPPLLGLAVRLPAARMVVARLLSQTWIGYGGSPAVAAPIGEPSGRLTSPGDHAPFGRFETGLDTGRGLFEVLRGLDRHLLVVEGTKPGGDLDAIVGRAGEAVARFAATINVVPIGRGNRELHRRYEATRATLVLVRPDGHIGFRSGADRRFDLESYLGRWYTRREPVATLPADREPSDSPRPVATGEMEQEPTDAVRALDGEVELDAPAYAGGTRALTATPVIGTPARDYPERYEPGTESLGEDDLRVVMLGSGPLFPRRVQASPSVLVEFGNGTYLIFDAGAGSVANFYALRVPQAEVRAIFLSHLHVDHVGDVGLHWLLGLPFGRQGPLEVCGPSGTDASLGAATFVEQTVASLRWDVRSRTGIIPIPAATIDVHEFDHAQPGGVYDRDGIRVTAFPVIHGIGGAFGYRVDYRGRSLVYSGDTKPSRLTVEHGQDVDRLLHEAVEPPAVMAERTGIPLPVAERVVLGLHMPPRSAGTVFAAARPRMAAMFHTFLAPDPVGPMFADLRATYDGPATLTQDLTVFDLSERAVVVRQAVPDLDAWPVPNRGVSVPGQVGERTAGFARLAGGNRSRQRGERYPAPARPRPPGRVIAFEGTSGGSSRRRRRTFRTPGAAASGRASATGTPDPRRRKGGRPRRRLPAAAA